MGCVLDIRAVNVADLISVAGGWLCDCAMAGWTVTVWAPQLEHVQALAILGVAERASEIEPVDALVVDGASRRDLARGRHNWVRHHVSAAARAFKARALLAANIPPRIVDLEMFSLGASNLLVAPDFAQTSATAVAP
ncbi:hypothetical protein [Mycolicibacterium tusciae]|jgi:hypothetical protein|uniref:Uncharacterized protein n=1 Tax=Mycolicibacterium tusciae TaxID=75922 RepID=A0A1X0JE52_9MYCO|nr:hypothetical protein [Mycolicibacterium tusciae]ORB61192.1 hypothetical protein BST47_28945 [Mycolicibacterium tusciae]